MAEDGQHAVAVGFKHLCEFAAVPRISEPAVQQQHGLGTGGLSARGSGLGGGGDHVQNLHAFRAVFRPNSPSNGRVGQASALRLK